MEAQSRGRKPHQRSIVFSEEPLSSGSSEQQEQGQTRPLSEPNGTAARQSHSKDRGGVER